MCLQVYKPKEKDTSLKREPEKSHTSDGRRQYYDSVKVSNIVMLYYDLVKASNVDMFYYEEGEQHYYTVL